MTAKKPLKISNGENDQYAYLAEKYEANKGIKSIENSSYKKYNP